MSDNYTVITEGVPFFDNLISGQSLTTRGEEKGGRSDVMKKICIFSLNFSNLVKVRNLLGVLADDYALFTGGGAQNKSFSDYVISR